MSQPQSRMNGTTTVVTNQPMKRKWMTGLSDCCANCSVCTKNLRNQNISHEKYVETF